MNNHNITNPCGDQVIATDIIDLDYPFVILIPDHLYQAAMAWCFENINDGGRNANEDDYSWYTSTFSIIDNLYITHAFNFKCKQDATWFQMSLL